MTEEEAIVARIYVALMEQRNNDFQRYGDYPYAPIEPHDAIWHLNNIKEAVNNRYV